MDKIRILIVDDSIFFRQVLGRHLAGFSCFEIVGYAANAFEAEKKVKELRPDVMTLDIEMPGMNGIDFLKKLLPQFPVPVVLVSSLNVSLFDALAAGAVDFVRKPNPTEPGAMTDFAQTLNSKLITASRAHVKRTLPAQTSNVPKAPSPLMSAKIQPIKLDTMIVAIGASTGGTEATLALLRQLPAQFPGTVITQHMPPGFTAMYAERLNRICNMEVREAKNGDKVTRGLALIAPGGMQMQLCRTGSTYTVRCYAGEKVNGLAPSVDVLFDSVAEKAGRNALGVILTGMGRDGAAGLLNMRQKGAFTVGQDKETCVVYGMPMAAQEIGAVCTQSPLERIPSVLMNYLTR